MGFPIFGHLILSCCPRYPCNRIDVRFVFDSYTCRKYRFYHGADIGGCCNIGNNAIIIIVTIVFVSHSQR